MTQRILSFSFRMDQHSGTDSNPTTPTNIQSLWLCSYVCVCYFRTVETKVNGNAKVVSFARLYFSQPYTWCCCSSNRLHIADCLFGTFLFSHILRLRCVFLRHILCVHLAPMTVTRTAINRNIHTDIQITSATHLFNAIAVLLFRKFVWRYVKMLTHFSFDCSFFLCVGCSFCSSVVVVVLYALLSSVGVHI